MPILPEAKRLELLKLLHEKPSISQRELAQTMGVSLGKTNYCLRALIEKGHVKFQNFHHNAEKRQHAYVLTKAGLKEKTRIALGSLRRKIAEYELLKKEIKALQNDLDLCRVTELRPEK